MSLGFLNDFIDKLKSKSATVAINISSNSTIEILELDKNGVINNYTSAPIQYNAFTKEIENISNFEAEVKKAFSELNLSRTSPVYISLPTYVIDHEVLPDSDDSEEIKMMLRATVEKNYIFKKYDPAISYYKLPGGGMGQPSSYCYTALRADEFAKIKGVFEGLGLSVKAIDSSHSALINGVIATRRVSDDIIANSGNWNIINITSNSFIIFAMQGKQLVSVYEEPIAVKSFSDEEVYQIITNSLDLVLENYPAQQLVIVSQSDNVSAEYLSSVLNTDTPKAFIEDNKYRKQLVELSLNITQSNKSKISLEAVGISTWYQNENGFKFNFMDVPISGIVDGAPAETIFVNVGGRDIEVTPDLVKKIALSIFIVVALILVAAYAALSTVKNAYDMEKMELTQQIAAIKKELGTKQEVTGMSEAQFLQERYIDNVKYKKSYSAIAQQIPKMLWIEEFQLAEDSKVYLAGRSYRMDDVLNYYDSLKNLGAFPNLRLTLLRISNTQISDLLLDEKSDMFEETTYEFAIGNPFFVDPNTVKKEKEEESDEFGDPLPKGAFGSDDVNKQDR